MGRDQFFNAGQVEALGAGRMLTADSTSDAIAQAAKDILGDDRYLTGAKQMAVAMRGYGGAAQAAAALEALAIHVHSTPPPEQRSNTLSARGD